MPTTEHIRLPLYTDAETPDLSTTGHYNHAMEILDGKVGELEAKDAELAENIADEREARIAGDSALDAKLAAETKARTDADTALNGKVAAETAAREAADTSIRADIDAETAQRKAVDTALDTAYKAADTALGSRIDNAETEISANSADLTGIKGLTYGEGGQVFLENENGSYTSPALIEIRHEISDLQSQGGGTGLTVINAPDDAPPNAADLYAKIQAAWPNCVITSGPEMFLPALAQSDTYFFNGAPDYTYHTLHRYTVSPNLAGRLDGLYATPDTTWGEIETAQ